MQSSKLLAWSRTFRTVKAKEPCLANMLRISITSNPTNLIQAGVICRDFTFLDPIYLVIISRTEERVYVTFNTLTKSHSCFGYTTHFEVESKRDVAFKKMFLRYTLQLPYHPKDLAEPIQLTWSWMGLSWKLVKTRHGPRFTFFLKCVQVCL